MNELKRKNPNKKGKLVGRGSKRGKTSGRGTKGQKARAGHRIRPHIRDIIKKLPKLRGRGKNINRAFRVAPSVINVGLIAKSFASGSVVSPATLLSLGLIRRSQGSLPTVKVLSTGEISHAVDVYDCLVTASAKAKIEKAGGTIH